MNQNEVIKLFFILKIKYYFFNFLFLFICEDKDGSGFKKCLQIMDSSFMPLQIPTIAQTSHTSYQVKTHIQHTHTYTSLSTRLSYPTWGQVKAEALKCKRFMKFIYVPVKMPTAKCRKEVGQ